MSRVALVLSLARQVLAGWQVHHSHSKLRVGTCVQLQRVRATWQRILCALEWACSCQCRQPARIHLATFECATQMCLLPHAWETQRPGIYHGVCVCAREKHVCVQARSLAELFVNALGQPSVLHKPR